MATLKRKEGLIMAYVLTNGKYYIRMTETGAIAKTDNIDEARVYLTVDKAKQRQTESVLYVVENWYMMI